jgi:hypothetical protein
MKNSLYIAKAFARWLFAKSGDGIVEIHKKFGKLIGQDFGLAFLLWLLFSLLGGVAWVVLSALLLPVDWIRVSIQTYIIVTVSYLVGSCLRSAYRSFVAERQELFDELKR